MELFDKKLDEFMTNWVKNFVKSFLSSHAIKPFFILTFQFVKQEVSAQKQVSSFSVKPQVDFLWYEKNRPLLHAENKKGSWKENRKVAIEHCLLKILKDTK